jgi:hypothetical protein
MDTFPPNSQKSKAAPPTPRRVERVTSAGAVRRRKPLGRQFKHTFFNGDGRSALEYMVYSVALPAFKEMMLDAATSGFERLIYGDSRPKRSGPSGPLGHVAYNKMRQPYGSDVSPVRTSRPSRARHDFGELIIASRAEAEEVLDRMYDLISKYDSASVADLYELTGIESAHTDHKWGWRELHGSSFGRVRGGGYLLNLPEPVPLD